MHVVSRLCEECSWWFRSCYDREQVEQEKNLAKFKKETLPILEKGALFEWIKDNSESSTLASALSFVTGTSSIPTSSRVLLTLTLPGEKSKVGNESIITKLANTVTGKAEETSLLWTSLENDKNNPKFSGKLALHSVQSMKVNDNTLIILDHFNNKLFLGKSPDSELWLKLLEETRRVLGPQLEEEAAASRGSSYHSRKLELLEQRKKQREEFKKQLGQVTMVYTAKAMMEKQ